MGAPPNRLSVPDSTSSMGPESSRSSPVRSCAPASRETETAASSRYVLQRDLEAAIKHLDDQQLDRLVSVALEERARRKKPPLSEKNQRKRIAENVSPRLPQGKLNAV